jgi:hypothetical protein
MSPMIIEGNPGCRVSFDIGPAKTGPGDKAIAKETMPIWPLRAVRKPRAIPTDS